jgi:hypothetical protein
MTSSDLPHVKLVLRWIGCGPWPTQEKMMPFLSGPAVPRYPDARATPGSTT